MNVAHCPAVIVVFAMEGCGACEDFKPRLEREVKRWQARGYPFIEADTPDQAFTAQQIPVIMLDAQSADPQVQALADDFRVEGLPTTIVFRRSCSPHVEEGAIDDTRIYQLLQRAAG